MSSYQSREIIGPLDSFEAAKGSQPYFSGYESRYGDCLAMIMDFLVLAARREDVFCFPQKHFFSKLALVCRCWSFIFRPLLFRRLTLWTLADVDILTDALRSPVSGWLRACVVSLMLEERKEEDAGVFGQPTWLPLLDETTALKALCVRTRLSAETRVNLLFAHAALLMHSAAHTLQHVALSGAEFRSFEALCSFVGGFNRLRGVYLERVLWEHPATQEVRKDKDAVLAHWSSRLKGGFTSLEMVCAEQCSDGRALAWMLAAASLRYEGVRESLNYGDLPQDLLVISKLIATIFDDYDLNVVARRVIDDKSMSLPRFHPCT